MLTNFTALLLLMGVLSGCSEEEAVKPEISAVRMDPDLMLEDDLGDLKLDLDINPVFLLRKEALTIELNQDVKPDVEELVVLGKDKLAKYNISPEQISIDPNDLKYAFVGLLINQLELAYANGYVVEFVEGPPLGRRLNDRQGRALG